MFYADNLITCSLTLQEICGEFELFLHASHDEGDPQAT